MVDGYVTNLSSTPIENIYRTIDCSRKTSADDKIWRIWNSKRQRRRNHISFVFSSVYLVFSQLKLKYENICRLCFRRPNVLECAQTSEYVYFSLENIRVHLRVCARWLPVEKCKRELYGDVDMWSNNRIENNALWLRRQQQSQPKWTLQWLTGRCLSERLENGKKSNGKFRSVKGRRTASLW